MIDFSNIKLGYDDVGLVQSLRGLNSRADINTHYKNEHSFPVFISPMTQLIDDKNAKDFERAGLIPVIHRGESLSFEERWNLSKTYWTAFGVSELLTSTKELKSDTDFHFICIDTPNGTMPILYNLVEKLKNQLNCKIMTGNINNPESICDAMLSGIDYLRVGIGGGSQCATSIKTGIYYPPISLINETNELRGKYIKHFKKYKRQYTETKIVADGGINEFGKIYKALAAGADYVMIGGLAASIKECCGQFYLVKADYDYRFDATDDLYRVTDYKFVREFYGMSTEKAQLEMGKSKLVPSEGTYSQIELKYSLESFTQNLSYSMKSCMAYLGINYVEDFMKAKLIRVTDSSHNNYALNKKVF